MPNNRSIFILGGFGRTLTAEQEAIRSMLSAGVSVDLESLTAGFVSERQKLDEQEQKTVQHCGCALCRMRPKVKAAAKAKETKAAEKKEFPEPVESGHYWAQLDLGFEPPQLVYVNKEGRIRLFGVNSSYPLTVAKRWLSGPVKLETPTPAVEVAESVEDVKRIRAELTQTQELHCGLLTEYESLVVEASLLRYQLAQIGEVLEQQ